MALLLYFHQHDSVPTYLKGQGFFAGDDKTESLLGPNTLLIIAPGEDHTGSGGYVTRKRTQTAIAAATLDVGQNPQDGYEA